MQIFNDHGWCYSCGKYADIFSFISKKEKLSFEQAVDWALRYKGILPEKVIKEVPNEYLGPLPLSFLDYWQKQLTDEHRQYFANRMITSETLDYYRIGYRPDYQAYTIPFWEGEPNQSDVVALQYRDATGKSNRKYWWETGRYKACLFNQRLINDDLVIVVFGTLDSVAGAFMGLPVVSASGLNTFANPKKMESVWLKEKLAHVKHKYVLPDATLTEFEPAYKVAHSIGAEICFFPRECGAKDLNEYFMLGYTADQFMKEVLEMNTATWYDGRLYALADTHIELTHDILYSVLHGKGIERYNEIQQAADEIGYHSSCVSHALQMMASSLGPLGFDASYLSSAEWSDMIKDFEDADGYKGLCETLIKWNDIANSKLGGF